MSPFLPAIVASWSISLGVYVYLGSEAERCTSCCIYRESNVSLSRLELFNERTQINNLARLTKPAEPKELSKYRLRLTSIRSEVADLAFQQEPGQWTEAF